jgi:hypothetical protein
MDFISFGHLFTQCSVDKELQALAASFPSDVKVALNYVRSIVFEQARIDDIVGIFCEKCGYERELKPLLIFVLDNHFGGKKSQSLDALKREQDVPHDNVIQVVMTMLHAAFSRTDNPLTKYMLSQSIFFCGVALSDFLSLIHHAVADFVTALVSCSVVWMSRLFPS